MGSMDGRVVLITGATQGIGKESAAALAALGATVVMVGRDRARGEAALAEVKSRSGSAKVELLLADLSSMAEVRRLAAEFKSRHDKLHVLLNNAGAINASRRKSPEGHELTFAVNHLAYFVLTAELLEVLKRSAPARVVNVASEAHRGLRLDFDDLMHERSYLQFVVYGRSKLANILFTYKLARRLKGTGITTNYLHPGMIASGFGHNDSGWFRLNVKLISPFMLSPEKGARTSVFLASSPEVEGVTGKYFKRGKEARSSGASRDLEAQRRLWEISERLVEAKAHSSAA